MAYSKSPTTLLRRQKHLEPMFRGETCRWTAPFPGGVDAQTWAYKVREALYVAAKNANRFAGLARYSKEYTVRVDGDKSVSAARTQHYLGSDEVLSDAVQSTGVVADNAPAPIVFADARTRYEIVQALMTLNGGRETCSFPNAILSQNELGKLLIFCQQLDHPRTIEQSPAGGLTIV